MKFQRLWPRTQAIHSVGNDIIVFGAATSTPQSNVFKDKH